MLSTGRAIQPLLTYGAALLAVAAAFALRYGLSFVLGPGLPPFIFFYPTALAMAFLAGLGPGLLAGAASAGMTLLLIYPSQSRIPGFTPVEAISVAIFFLSCAGASIVSEMYRRSRQRTAAYREQLSRGESEARFSTIFHDSPIAMSIANLRSERFLDVNQAFLDQLGYTWDEVIDHTPADVGIEFLSGHLPAKLRPTGEAVSGEIRYRGRSGGARTALVSAEPIPVAGVACVWTVIQDITERKNMEEHLRESEERFRGILESMLEGFQLIGSDWRYLYINAAAEKHNRRPNGELLGNRYMDMWPGIEATEVFAVINRCMVERIPQVMENEFTFPDGKKGWFDLRVSPVPEGIVIFSDDISERKRAEEALRLSEEKFSQAFANAPAGIALTRAQDDVFLEVNDRWVEMVGYSREEAIGQSALGMGIWSVPADARRFTQGLEEEGSLRGWEVEFRKKTGELFSTQLSAQRMRVKGEQAVLSIMVDITDRKRAERELRDSQQLLQVVMDLVPPFIFAKDRGSRHLFVNRACAEANGLTPDRMIGLTDLDLVADRAQAEGFMRDDREVIDRGEAKVNIEERLTDRAGRTRVLQTTKIPFTPPGSSQKALLGVAVDITELRLAGEEIRLLNSQLERRVEERTAELAAANKELEAFAYAVSHDLRAPLRALNGFSQALQEDFAADLKGEAGKYLGQIHLASLRMSELIDGILTLSRTTRGELRREGVDLSSMASRILEDLAKREPGRRVSWTVQPALRVQGDARLIENVLENLLGNAWKYTSRTDRAEIRFYAEGAEGEMAFCVADNGAGFDMRHADRLFKPFQRLHRQEEFQGTGIGLATVHRIIQRHGGTLTAAGEPGKGAVFSFSLSPRKMAAALNEEQK